MSEVIEPPTHERIYYRNTRTGDLGWLVKRDGRDYIRMDRPKDTNLRPYSPSEWQPEHEHRRMTVMQAAMVAFEADKKLCFFLGEHKLAKREWLDLKQEAKTRWTHQGPKRHEARKEMYSAIMAALSKWAG